MVGFRRAKNKSSSHRQGVRVGTRKMGFRQRSKRGDFEKSKLSGLGGFLPSYHAPKGKGILPNLAYFPSLGRENRVFRLRAWLAKKNGVFGFYSMFLILGKGVNLPTEDWFFA